jgi:chromosome segregation ATPase
MFSRLFDKASGFVRVSKENYAKIENLFQEKNDKISELQSELDKLKIDCKDALRYKANDSLVEAYEIMVKKMKDENNSLKAELNVLETGINSAMKKVDSVMGLESAYLQKIVKLQHKCDRAELINTLDCPKYEERGQNIIELYA